MSEKLQWLVLGMAIGAVLGYFARSLREIKEELDEVAEFEKKRVRNEDGFMRIPVVADVLLLGVILLTVWAAFASQGASNQVKDQQDDIDNVVDCNTEYLDKTIVALNERTTFSTQQAQSNVELQRAQSEFLAILLVNPPASDARVAESLRRYFDTLNEFTELAGKTAVKAETNPYPSKADLQNCLDDKE